MGATGERLATIEANTTHIKDQVDDLKTSVNNIREKLDLRLDVQGKTVDRHSVYFQIAGWALGIGTAALTVWLTGVANALIKIATAAMEQ